MATADKLFRGNYKGVDFLASTFSTGGGRKTVIHSYPNSDKQLVEDLGLQPRSYSITIIINDKGDYFINRDRILSVLNDGESGKLVHPLYGDIENIKVGTYTLSENLTELGVGTITVVFQPSEGTGIPEKSDTSLNAVEASNTNLVNAVNVNFADNYETSISFPNSYDDSLVKLNDSVTAFDSANSIAQANADKIDAFNAELQTYQNNITALIRQPQQLANSIGSLLASMGNLYPTAAATVAALEDLFNFGDDDVSLSQNTASRVERTKNRKILNDSIQSLALSYSYLSSAQLVFNTVDDIDMRADILETQYQKLSISNGLDSTAKRALLDLRVNVQIFFEEQKLTAQQVITVETNLIPARVLAYQYYGNSEKGEQLAELNESAAPSFLDGNVKVFTE